MSNDVNLNKQEQIYIFNDRNNNESQNVNNIKGNSFKIIFKLLVYSFLITIIVISYFYKNPKIDTNKRKDTIKDNITNNTDTINTDTIKTDTTKTDTIKTDSIKTDTIKTDTIKTDTIKTDSIKTDSIKTDTIKTDIIKTDTIKTDTIKTDTNKTDVIKTDIEINPRPPPKTSYTLQDYQEYYKIAKEGKILYKENLVKSENPIISVIIALYNAEKYINATLKSVQNQRMKDIEIIIVDDCSNDKSLLYAEEARKKDPRITVTRNKKKYGYFIYKINRLFISERKLYIYIR